MEAGQKHVDYMMNHDLMTENTQSCTSAYGNHRVIPYHWKHMNEDQRRKINEEQEAQRRQKEVRLKGVCFVDC